MARAISRSMSARMVCLVTGSNTGTSSGAGGNDAVPRSRSRPGALASRTVVSARLSRLASLALIAAACSTAPTPSPPTPTLVAPTATPATAPTADVTAARAEHIVDALDTLAAIQGFESVSVWAIGESRWTIDNIGAGTGPFGDYSLAMLDLLGAIEAGEWDAEVAALLRLRPTFVRLGS